MLFSLENEKKRRRGEEKDGARIITNTIEDACYEILGPLYLFLPLFLSSRVSRPCL